MYWEEKLDLIKQQFPKSAFRDPFTDWPEILKKIEGHFILKSDGKHPFCNWFGHIKQQQIIGSISAAHLSKELKKLAPIGNFWLVMVYGTSPSAKHLVYDCSLAPLIKLLPDLFDFFIIDKKYKWLCYFSRSELADKIVMYRSGNALSPFDN